MSSRKDIGEYWGDRFLEDLVKQCDETAYKRDQDYLRKRDKALVATLFLTGGFLSEVLTLKKDNFDFEDEEAKRMNAFLVRNMIVGRHIFKKGNRDL